MAQEDPGPMGSTASAADVVRSLHRAVGAHDLEGIVAHFAPDYALEDPVRPDRSFRGREQVRRNWSHLLASMDGLALEERRLVADGSTVWTEIAIRGRLADGREQALRGVMIFRVAGGLIAAGTFYLAPVVRDGLDADAAVLDLVSEPGR
ncbi:nuclear transport factor 2 family protein [Agrococcus sp. BE272]|uniref:nuclear transport factor 2 family protein n=1 Tax=Agrococcus sp. BE272 TaxID=2817727 RepID=UPI00286296AA|nr:nuclear transport factor 2 family protein [Agrococcus sp. BE272]MDR7233890.1 ketosteroid isomerase-like protein [Agrococcus sp. BE272]